MAGSRLVNGRTTLNERANNCTRRLFRRTITIRFERVCELMLLPNRRPRRYSQVHDACKKLDDQCVCSQNARSNVHVIQITIWWKESHRLGRISSKEMKTNYLIEEFYNTMSWWNWLLTEFAEIKRSWTIALFKFSNTLTCSEKNEDWWIFTLNFIVIEWVSRSLLLKFQLHQENCQTLVFWILFFKLRILFDIYHHRFDNGVTKLRGCL